MVLQWKHQKITIYLVVLCHKESSSDFSVLGFYLNIYVDPAWENDTQVNYAFLYCSFVLNDFCLIANFQSNKQSDSY